jgi:hypothetical protein
MWYISYSEWPETRRFCIAIGPQFCLKYAIRKVQENQVGLELNGTHKLFVYADDINLLDYNINTIKKRTQKPS